MLTSTEVIYLSIVTLYDFIQMDEMEQAEAFWSGTLAGTRHGGEYRIILYKIDDFYVEAWYHVEHNVLKKMRKVVLVLFWLTTLSCGKHEETQTCWRCALSEQGTGRPLPTKDTCTESDPSTFHF